MNTHLSTATTQETLPIKVLMFASDFESGKLLMRQIKKGSHQVVETVDDPDHLLIGIARTRPHLVVAHVPDRSPLFGHISKALNQHFPELPVCLLQGDLSKGKWKADLDLALAQPLRPEVPRPYADGNRVVLHDESLQAFWKGKLKRPQREAGWENICSSQEARFVLQLQAGRKNHIAARSYYECLVAQQSGLDQELAYRLAHGSYKALSWSRDLACKWLALLAHYVPDAELQFLPPAGTPGPSIDYVHHDTPLEGIYAATLMLASEVQPSVAETIKELLVSRFEQQDANNLLAISLKLYGTAKFLQQVGTAQIELMEAWLNPAIIDRLEGANIPRGEQRNAGIYRDFYGLNFIVYTPEPLHSILKGFHAGTTYVEAQRFLPSFAEFRRICRKNYGAESKTESRPE